MAWTILASLALAVPFVFSTPAAEPIGRVVPFIEQLPTPTSAPFPTNVKRSLGDEVKSLLGDLPSEVASGVPVFFENFPTGASVQSSLSLDDSQVAALPTSVLNLP